VLGIELNSQLREAHCTEELANMFGGGHCTDTEFVDWKQLWLN